MTKAKPRRRWLPHAIGAGSLALLAFLGGAAPEFLSDEFKAKFAPYNKWIVGFIILAAIVEVICAFVIARRSASEADPPAPANTTTGDRNVSIAGSSSGSAIIPGDHNVVAQTVNIHQSITSAITAAAAPAPEPTVTPLHQLPAPPHDFIGREQELSDLLDRLGQGVTISGMQGLGGVGKTALALVLAERIKPRYPDAQLYLDLQGASDHPLSTEDAMRHVIRAWRPAARLPESPAELAAIYRSVLHGQRALLMMDNAASRQQVEPLIPPDKNCVLLVTSRRQFALPGMYARNLDELPREDSIRLLRSIAARIGEHADEIARLCGDLPLALRVAGAALAETRNLAPAEYARRLGDQRLRHLPDVEAALNVSYEMLLPEQQQWWSALGVFPASFDDAAAGAVWQMSPDAARDALAGLMRWSLVEFDEDAVRYRLHDLARLFAAERLEDAAARQRFAQHYCAVLGSCNSLYLEGGESVRRGLALFDREWENVRTGQAWAEVGAETDPVAGQLCLEYPNSGIYVLLLRQHPREQIHWQQTCLAIARQLNQRKSESRALGSLGNAWVALGETRKAIEFYEQALVIDREIGDRRGEGNAICNLGSAWYSLGKTRKAIEFYEQHLAIAREIGDRRGEYTALTNVGVAWVNLGETPKAIELHEQALIITQELGDLIGEGSVLCNLGLAWTDLGEKRKASGFFEQYLTITREVGNRRGEGGALANLSKIYFLSGRKAQAIAFAEASLRIFGEFDDPKCALVKQQLATYRKLGHFGWLLGFLEKPQRIITNRLQQMLNVRVEATLAVLETIEHPYAERVRQRLAEWRGQ